MSTIKQRSEAAALMGRKGGLSRSPRKIAAGRINAQKALKARLAKAASQKIFTEPA